MLYTLHNDCPVKWTAVQERSISREYPSLSLSSSSSSDPSLAPQIRRVYHQFLWLPEVSTNLSPTRVSSARARPTPPLSFCHARACARVSKEKKQRFHARTDALRHTMMRVSLRPSSSSSFILRPEIKKYIHPAQPVGLGVSCVGTGTDGRTDDDDDESK